ncbi:response regulator [Calditrichota bacterium]
MSTQKLLIIDDEKVIRDTLRQMILHFGIECDTAESGQVAIDFVAAGPEKYKAVFLDLSMPVMDGPDVLVRLNSLAPEIPVYIVSGYAGEEIEERLHNNRISGTLPKPFKLLQLKEIIDELESEVVL